MIQRWATLLGALIAVSGTVAAQEISIVDSVYMRSEQSSDGGRYLPFGVGSMYSDESDEGTRDFEVPFAPPSGFYTLMLRVCDGGFGGECYYEGDLRAVPEDVANGEVKQFALTYKVSIQRGIGRNVIIDFVREFAPGIDSINMQDLLTGTIYNHTFTSGVSEDTLYNDGINQLQITVYYNLEQDGPSAVDEKQRSVVRGLFAPNPVTVGGILVYRGTIPSGSQMIVTDLLGRTVAEVELGAGGSEARMQAPTLSTGAYFCTIVDRRGVPLHRESVVITR